MIKRKFIAFVMISMFLFSGFTVSMVADEDNNSEIIQKTDNAEMKKWTFMLYDDADFTYSWYDPGIWDITRESKPYESLNIVVLQDTVYGPAKMWCLGKLGQKKLIKHLGEINMGDYKTLKDFIAYCKENFPAERYMLDLFDHGGGWVGACWDETNDNDGLTMDEMQRALNETGGVDIITFNAPCSMSAIESVYELRNCVDVYVGSEAGNQYDFRIDRPIFDLMNNNFYLSNVEIGRKIIEITKETEEKHPFYPFPRQTMSAMRTDEIVNLVSSIDNLSRILSDSLDEYYDDIKSVYAKTQLFGSDIDVYDFAENYCKIDGIDGTLYHCLQKIMEDVNKTVVSEYHADNYPGAHGLTISFPTSFMYYSPYYGKCGLDFASDTHWNEFLVKYTVPDARVDDDGNADYVTIQEAIDNASNDDVIYVCNGTYHENIVISKSITLIGEMQYPYCTIDGDKIGDVISITADGVELCGLTIRNSSDNGVGINLHANSVKIIGCHVYKNSIGMSLNDSSNSIITSNFIENSNKYGIFLILSSANYIVSNTFKSNKRDASFFDSSRNTWDNTYLEHPKKHIKIILGYKTMGKFSVPQINIDRHRYF